MSEINKLAQNRFIELKQDKTKASDEKLREVSDMYEKYFIKEMMKNMKSTVAESGLIKKNNAEKIFEDQLDDQYSSEWNKRGGFGLSDMIYNQLKSKFGDQMDVQNLEEPKGPAGLQQKIQLNPLDSSSFNIQFDDDKSSQDVLSPWAGTLLSKNRLEGDKVSYRIKHDNGLESLIMIQGGATEQTRHLSPGDVLSAGQALGRSQAGQPMVWSVKKSVS